MPEDLLGWLWLDQGGGSSKISIYHRDTVSFLVPFQMSSEIVSVNSTPSIYSLRSLILNFG